MSSLIINPNNQDTQFQQWYNDAQTQLKPKIKKNINKRATNSIQAINNSIKCLIQNTKSNHIWSSLFPDKHINTYDNIFPTFSISETLINNSLQKITEHDMRIYERPNNFQQYMKRANGWWNRHKAEWIGSHFFYPLL
eukprot:268241_1